MRAASKWIPTVLVPVSLGMLAYGAYLGLVWAPPDREMGDVQRIMYVHVPAVWMSLLALTLNLAASVSYLLKPDGKRVFIAAAVALIASIVLLSVRTPGASEKMAYTTLATVAVLVALVGFVAWVFDTPWKVDSLAEASAAQGVFFGAVGIALGSIWGKPTWNVWWDWDPRLTTAAIMLVVYTGYLALRKFVDDPERRAVWSAVIGIIAYVDIPIVWFSVRWWRSLHQIQSNPSTVDPQMTYALRWNAFAFLAIFALFLLHRYRLALAARENETRIPELATGGG